MDETKLAILILAASVFVLAAGLVIANLRTARFADKSLEHCMAFHSDQREYMRIRFDSEHQEFLLREARERERIAARRIIPEMRPDDDDVVPNIPIESNTQT